MKLAAGKKGYRLSITTACAMLALGLVAVVWSSVNDPGPSDYLELDSITTIGGGNIGFDSSTGSFYDWANAGAGAATDPRDCPDTVDPGTGDIAQSCNGIGGIFDGGVFHDATHAPTAPSVTAAAAAELTIVEAQFRVDELSVDNAIVHNPPTDPTAPTVMCGTGDPTVFTAVGGETNGDDINTETFSTGSVPNKDEISNAYAISHQNPPNPMSSGGDDINEIFAGFERVVNNGDSHVDLEFLQQPVSLVPGSKPAQFPCAGKLQGHRTGGDLLLSVDFTNGGAIGNPDLHRWNCGDFPNQPIAGVCDPVARPGKKIAPFYEEVSDTLTLAAVKQKTNADAAIGCGGWACRNADGTETETVATDQFYEVGIDLAALGFEGCLSTFLPHTRSSQSFTAVLKDFALIPFNTCRPSTILTKAVDKPVITIGDSVTYTYTETNDGNVPLTNPFVTDDKCSPVTFVDDDGGDNNGNDDLILDPGEVWNFTCTKAAVTANTTNTAVGHGTFTIFGQSKDVTFCSDPANPPAGTICDQDERAQATVTVLTPSTKLNKTATPSVVTTVTYTYAEMNDGQVALAPPTAGVRSSLVTDAICVGAGGSVTYTGGDTNNNSILDVSETWNFSCTVVFNGPGTFANTAVGHGIDNLGRDVTICPAGGSTSGKFCDADETDSTSVAVSVTVNNGK